MAGTANQARPPTELAPASVVSRRPETLVGVPRVSKGEIHQLNLGRGLQFEEGEVLAMQG